MIRVTTLDGSEIFINPDLIEIISETPDTHITLSNGNRYLVRERAQVVISRIVSFKARLMRHGRPDPRPKYLAKKDLHLFRPGGGR